MDYIPVIINLFFLIILLALGFFVGSWQERRHFREIEIRERDSLHVPLLTAKTLDMAPEQVESAYLVQGSAVISIDYFKRLLAGLRNLVGGRISAYESLLDRARREALLRMKESAPDASMIINVRLENAAIGMSAQQGNLGSVEVLAYGTAVKLKAGHEIRS